MVTKYDTIFSSVTNNDISLMTVFSRQKYWISSTDSINIYVTHSQSVDGGAEPAILAEFGKGSVVRVMNRHSRALGSRSQQRSSGTNNNDPWQQSAHAVKETKSLLVVASGLTRLRCLARVSRALLTKLAFGFNRKQNSSELGSMRGLWRELAFIRPWRRQNMTSTFQTGTSWWKLTWGERDWWTQSRLLRDWLSPTLRSREQRALRLLKIE